MIVVAFGGVVVMCVLVLISCQLAVVGLEVIISHSSDDGYRESDGSSNTIILQKRVISLVVCSSGDRSKKISGRIKR